MNNMLLELLSRLKDMVRQQMPTTNVKEYTVDWSDMEKGGISKEAHKDYLKELCDDFYTQVTGLIESAVRAQDSETKVTTMLSQFQNVRIHLRCVHAVHFESKLILLKH